jgi:N-succinyl-L-ornithine transcarbamylase
MKNFLSVKDVPSVDFMVEKALSYKADPFKDEKLGHHKRIGLLFFNPSMRTRVSTQLAAKNLGMEAIVLNVGSEGWTLEFAEGAVMNGTSVEHIKDAAPILGSYFDILAIRSFPKFLNRDDDQSEQVMKSFVQYAKVPVVSLESSTRHPLQSLADIITIKEHFQEKRKPKVVLTWAPHIKAIPHCVANSFSEWVSAWEQAEFVIAHPKGYELSPEFTRGAHIVHDQKEALEGADFVYVKNWSSFEPYGQVLGEYPEWMLREKSFESVKNTKAKVMHCLPLRRNVELSDEILDGPRSLLTKLAQNRVWSAQAVLSEVLRG